MAPVRRTQGGVVGGIERVIGRAEPLLSRLPRFTVPDPRLTPEQTVELGYRFARGLLEAQHEAAIRLARAAASKDGPPTGSSSRPRRPTPVRTASSRATGSPSAPGNAPGEPDTTTSDPRPGS